MADAGVVKGDVLDPSARVLLGGIHRVKVLLAGRVPFSLGIWPGAGWMSGEPVRTIWSHLYLLVQASFVPKGGKQHSCDLSKQQ